MDELARAWLGGLTAAQQAQARYRFADDARRDWHYTPRSRPGLPLGAMDASSRARAWAMVDAALSEAGRTKVREVLALEAVLGDIEGRPARRDPSNYALAVFGEPGTEAPWAWRFEGHHVSLTLTHVPGAGVAVTPSFFGANPAIVPAPHAHAGAELLVVPRKLAFELLHSLDPSSRAQCVLAIDAPRDILTGPGAERRLERIEGLALAELALGQQELGWHLLSSFLVHLADDHRAAAEARIRDVGLGRVHFAWAGGDRLGDPHYFRLHGPATVVEYDNVQNAANHVHAVWHEPDDVFGDDRLRRHHLDAH
ncbi:MAG: DUF3500 domain-containing protein [Pseudomonadota bacterium]